ncbi:MAG: alpha/beta hydrolase [Patescibacteria group bacterium]
MVAAENPKIFVLVPGCWHPPEVMDLLRFEINKLGHESLAPKLPISDPDATFDDHAKVVADACRDEERVILVGHSRSGNVIPRAAGLVAVAGLVYMCATFEPATLVALKRPTDEEKDNMPPRIPKYRSSPIKDTANGLTVIDPKAARELFYNDCSDRNKDWAVSILQPQRRSSNEPSMLRWPDNTAQYSIICTDDRATNPDWLRYIYTRWLNLTPVELPGGHSPFLSRPQKLARVLVSFGVGNDGR